MALEMTEVGTFTMRFEIKDRGESFIVQHPGFGRYYHCLGRILLLLLLLLLKRCSIHVPKAIVDTIAAIQR